MSIVVNKMRKLFWILFFGIGCNIKLEGNYFLCARGIGDTIIFLSKLKYTQIDFSKEKINLIIQDNQKVLIEAYSRYVGKYIVLNRNKMNFCIKMAMRGFLANNLRFIIPDGAYTFLGYRGLSISDLMNITLNLPPEMIEYEKPHFEWDDRRKQEVITKNNLESKQFVILGIDAESVLGIDKIIWEKIVKCLKKKGYIVVSNLRSPEQTPINETIGLYLPLNEIYLLAEYGGWFIGLRNGLCDLLAYSSCKMTVIYPSEKDKYKFSFDNMHFEKEIEEIMLYEVEKWLDMLA